MKTLAPSNDLLERIKSSLAPEIRRAEALAASATLALCAMISPARADVAQAGPAAAERAASIATTNAPTIAAARDGIDVAGAATAEPEIDYLMLSLAFQPFGGAAEGATVADTTIKPAAEPTINVPRHACHAEGGCCAFIVEALRQNEEARVAVETLGSIAW